jgi:hypothetical protein
MFTDDDLKRLRDCIDKGDDLDWMYTIHDGFTDDKHKALLDRLEAADELKQWLCHEQLCILSQWSEGEPTKDGGYRSRYAGKWYERGKEPKCNCGLDEALAAYNKTRGIK